MQNSKFKGKIFVISAPSGTGKTTILKELKKEISDIEPIITYTTRKQRPGEKNKIDYYFISQKTFLKKIKENKFLEWAKVYDNYYGTPKDKVEKVLKKGKKILLTLDTQGGRNIKKLFPSAILIGILPPSFKEQERRIRERKGISEEEIKKRLKEAKQERKIIFTKYDVRVVNKNLESTIKKIKNIIEKYGKYSNYSIWKI